MLKLNLTLACCTILVGCAAKKPVTKPVQPAPAVEAAKPRPRPIRAGDYILKGAEVLPDGTVVCHKAIQVIDSTKRNEDVTIYRCR